LITAGNTPCGLVFLGGHRSGSGCRAASSRRYGRCSWPRN